MNNDLISREALKAKMFDIPKPKEGATFWDGVDTVGDLIDKAPTVNLEKTSFMKGYNYGCDDGKKFYERPQGERIENKVIVETLREMLSNLCMGCGGCNDRCLDYRVLEYLLKEKGR